jgi:hypothetical protein
MYQQQCFNYQIAKTEYYPINSVAVANLYDKNINQMSILITKCLVKFRLQSEKYFVCLSFKLCAKRLLVTSPHYSDSIAVFQIREL